MQEQRRLVLIYEEPGQQARGLIYLPLPDGVNLEEAMDLCGPPLVEGMRNYAAKMRSSTIMGNGGEAHRP